VTPLERLRHGASLSTSFPTTPGAFQVNLRGGFIRRLRDKAQRRWFGLGLFHYLGGSVDDRGTPSPWMLRNAYVTGSPARTTSHDLGRRPAHLPVSARRRLRVESLTRQGPPWSTPPVSAAPAASFGNGIAVDVAGYAYGRQTTSPNFPTTLGRFSPAPPAALLTPS